MFNVKSLNGTTLLADQRIERHIYAAAMLPCFTAREVAEERGRRMEEAKQAGGRAVRAVEGKIAVIGVHGPIEQHVSSALMKAGGTSCDEISAALDACMATSDVAAIVLHVDSPGGSSYGVEELSDKIFAARQKKPIYAIADSLSASAAYWLATSAETLWCTPGGDVGSVGVFSIYIDESKAIEAMGLAVTLIRAGEYKAEGIGLGPLSKDAIAHRQNSVDETYGKFTDSLARNRSVSKSVVRSDFGKGRMFGAEQALAAKMIDRIGSFETMMTQLTGSGTSSKAAAMDMKRKQNEQRKREAEWLKIKPKGTA